MLLGSAFAAAAEASAHLCDTDTCPHFGNRNAVLHLALPLHPPSSFAAVLQRHAPDGGVSDPAASPDSGVSDGNDGAAPSARVPSSPAVFIPAITSAFRRTVGALCAAQRAGESRRVGTNTAGWRGPLAVAGSAADHHDGTADAADDVTSLVHSDGARSSSSGGGMFALWALRLLSALKVRELDVRWGWGGFRSRLRVMAGSARAAVRYVVPCMCVLVHVVSVPWVGGLPKGQSYPQRAWWCVVRDWVPH